MKLAFLGFRHPHIHALYQHASELAEIEIVAACEEDAATRAALAQKPNIRLTHTAWQTMLDEITCDTVAVGDYFARRGELILALLERGKHVLVDKPVCTDLAELDAIERKLQSSGLKLGCMLDLRDSPQVVGLRTLIRSGLIGEIHAITFGGGNIRCCWGRGRVGILNRASMAAPSTILRSMQSMRCIGSPGCNLPRSMRRVGGMPLHPTFPIFRMLVN